MIQITTDEKLFWNNEVNPESKVFIYGAGTIGDTMGRVLIKAGIPLEGYIDSKAKGNQTYLGKIIVHPSQVNTMYSTVKIILSVNDLIGSLRVIEQNIDNALVLMPKLQANGNDFNTALSVCRYKMLKNTNFTIISNNCSAGAMYRFLGAKMQTPTVNLLIEPSDYVKFCSNLVNYLKQELKFSEYSQWRYGFYHPIAYLGDVQIHFLHYKSFEDAQEAWLRRRERVNMDNLFMVFDDTHYKPTYENIKSFLDIPYGKKLVLQRTTAYPVEHSIFTTTNFHVFEPGKLVEDWFDLVSWINGDTEY